MTLWTLTLYCGREYRYLSQTLVGALRQYHSGTAFRGGEDQAARTDQRGAGIVGGQRQGWGRMSSPFRDARPFIKWDMAARIGFLRTLSML